MFSQYVIPLIANICWKLVTLNPNAGNEMGRYPNDRAYPGGEIKYFQYKHICYHLIVVVSSMIYVVNAEYPYMQWYDYILLYFLLLGTGVRLWCYGILGRFFTFRLGIRQSHILVEEGPYDILIHPSYTAQVTAILSILLLLRMHWLPFALLAWMIARIVKSRMAKEEDMMQKHFGKKYEKYIEGKWRLIPYVY